MKVSLRWLSDYVPLAPDLDPHDLAHRLTLAGIEVGGVEATEGWDHVYVGQVARIEKHPNADRLVLATVDLGGREQTVVTGAPNLQPGQKVPFAEVGATLFSPKTGQQEVLKPAKLRGVESRGMVCSAVELGLGEDHSGILVLPDTAPVGTHLREYLGDTILDCEVTPNRPDCLSLLGIGHEVAALTGAQLREPDLTYPSGDIDAADKIAVEIEDPDLCRRYVGAYLENVTVGPSPDWLQQRLTAAGMRPINNIVDVTNYVMLEYGQPLHAFDYDLVRRQEIIVRRAWLGEKLRTLDGVDRVLDPSILVIADAEGAVAIAGVMGGENSEVSAGTRRVLLEAANFNNISIRRTSRALKLRSEASARFDKGISPALIDRAVHRAVQLIAEVSGATPAPTVVDNYPRPHEQSPIALHTRDVRRLLGVDWPVERIRATLESLNFDCRTDPDDSQGLVVTPPYYRMDIALAEDLVEEVARIVGYDEVPARPLTGRIPAWQPAPIRELTERVRDTLVACGLQEVINYTLVSGDLLAKTPLPRPIEPIRVTNPMSAEQEFLRTSLRGSLLQNAATNQRWSPDALRFFEIGTAFLPRDGDLPKELPRAAGLLAGLRRPPGWTTGSERVDFYDAKGIVETLLRAVRIPNATFEPADDPLFHPGKAARIAAQGATLGVVGEVHPTVVGRFEIDTRPVCYFELDLEALLAATTGQPPFQPLPRYPAVVQDLALEVDRDVPAAALAGVLAEADLVASVRLFDVYEGDPLPAGKRSLAFTISYQSPERTLTDEDVAAIQRDLVHRAAERFGARLRSSG